MRKTFDSSLWSRYFGDRWKAAFFCPGCLSGKREQEGKGRMHFSLWKKHFWRLVSRGSKTFNFSAGRNLQNFSEGYFCSEGFKIETANCNPFAVNTDGLNDSALTTMSSLTQIQRKWWDGDSYTTWQAYPSVDKVSHGSSASICFGLPLWVWISFTFSIKAHIFNQLPFEIIYSFTVMLQSLLIQTKQ